MTDDYDEFILKRRCRITKQQDSDFMNLLLNVVHKSTKENNYDIQKRFSQT